MQKALCEERAAATAAATAAAGRDHASQKRIAQLESQVSEENLLRIQAERERDEMRNTHRNADEEHLRKLQSKHAEYKTSIAELEVGHERRLADQQADFQQRIAEEKAQHTADRDKLIEQIKAVESQLGESKARSSGIPPEVLTELAVLRKDLAHEQ